jgi:hypothetical protein
MEFGIRREMAYSCCSGIWIDLCITNRIIGQLLFRSIKRQLEKIPEEELTGPFTQSGKSARARPDRATIPTATARAIIGDILVPTGR